MAFVRSVHGLEGQLLHGNEGVGCIITDQCTAAAIKAVLVVRHYHL
jgi:hypothetical protein